MFWAENVRFCKNCKYYQMKDWSPWNYECKFGKELSSGGNTEVCKKYKEKFSIFSGNYHCKDCARWETASFFGGKCIKKYTIPKGEDSDACEKFVKG